MKNTYQRKIRMQMEFQYTGKKSNPINDWGINQSPFELIDPPKETKTEIGARECGFCGNYTDATNPKCGICEE